MKYGDKKLTVGSQDTLMVKEWADRIVNSLYNASRGIPQVQPIHKFKIQDAAILPTPLSCCSAPASPSSSVILS
jgi:hypothetical protein